MKPWQPKQVHACLEGANSTPLWGEISQCWFNFYQKLLWISVILSACLIYFGRAFFLLLRIAGHQ